MIQEVFPESVKYRAAAHNLSGCDRRVHCQRQTDHGHPEKILGQLILGRCPVILAIVRTLLAC